MGTYPLNINLNVPKTSLDLFMHTVTMISNMLAYHVSVLAKYLRSYRIHLHHNSN